MQIYQGQDIQIDSSGLMYGQHYENLPLANYFLELNFINYSKGLIANESIAINPKISSHNQGNGFLAFQYSDFVLIVLILLFSLIAYIRISGKNYFNRLIMSIQNYSYSVSFFREKNLAFVLYNYIMMFVFYISAGMLSAIVFNFFNIPLPYKDDFTQLLIIIAVLFSLNFLNQLSIRLGGAVFGQYRVASEYLFYFSNFLKIVGIGSLVLVVILFFTNKNIHFIFIYIAVFIGLVTYLVKVIRVLVIFFTNRFSLYYLILYFCALEIIPVVLIIKVFRHLIQNGYSFSGILV
jgi:hypothetical protein